VAILLGNCGPQGLSPVLSTIADDPTVIVEIPDDACWPAHIAVDNVHASATVYLKWVQIDATGQVSSTNFSRKLGPGDGYVWDEPPRGCKLIAIASTGSVQLSCDMNWSYLSAEGPVS
jgi:hypothetical protein